MCHIGFILSVCFSYNLCVCVCPLCQHGVSGSICNITKVKEDINFLFFTGHTDRVLTMCLSPDQQTVVSAAGDETLRFWRCFSHEPKKKTIKTASSGETKSRSLFASTIRWLWIIRNLVSASHQTLGPETAAPPILFFFFCPLLFVLCLFPHISLWHLFMNYSTCQYCQCIFEIISLWIIKKRQLSKLPDQCGNKFSASSLRLTCISYKIVLPPWITVSASSTFGSAV